jgi:hypothetical protein
MPKAIKNTPAFHYSREIRKSFNRCLVCFALETLTDRIMPDQFEAHKKAVNGLWPETNFQFQFPIGLAAPPRKQKPDGSLLPPFRKKDDPQFQPTATGESAERSPLVWKKELVATGNENTAVQTEFPVSIMEPGISPARKRKRRMAAIITVALIAWAVLAWLLYKA